MKLPVSAENLPSSAFLLIWPFIYSAPLLVTGEFNRVWFVALAAPFLILSAFNAFSQTQRNLPLGYASLLALFTLLVAIAAVRADPAFVEGSARYGIAAIVLVFGGIAAFSFFGVRKSAPLAEALRFSLPVYVSINLVLYFVFGPEWIEPAKKTVQINQNELIGMAGIVSERVSYMGLIKGSNVIGMLAGISIVLMATRLRLREGRYLTVALLVFNCFALVLVETRAAILASVLCVILYYQYRALPMLQIARGAVIFSALSPVVLAFVFWTLTNSSIASALVRSAGNSEDLGVGSGRAYILDVGIGHLSDFRFEHVWGLGYYSHITTNIVQRFEWVFAGELTRSSFHNTTLQNIFDIGYVGAALYLWLLWASFERLHRAQSKIGMISLLFIVLCGYTEVAGTLYHFELLCLQLALFAIALVATPRTNPRRAIARSAPRPSRAQPRRLAARRG